MLSKKVRDIQKIYDAFYHAVSDYLVKNFGILGKKLVVDVIKKIDKQYPELKLDIASAERNKRLPKYTLPAGITVSEKIKLGNSILNIIRVSFRNVMGPAGEGLLRNAIGPVYEKKEREIKKLGIKLPPWLISQMKKRSLIGTRMAEAFGGL